VYTGLGLWVNPQYLNLEPVTGLLKSKICVEDALRRLKEMNH